MPKAAKTKHSKYFKINDNKPQPYTQLNKTALSKTTRSRLRDFAYGSEGTSYKDGSPSHVPPPSLFKEYLKPPPVPMETSTPRFTPLEQQVLSLKALHPGVLLLVECGYKFRLFGEDAEVAAKDLKMECYWNHNFASLTFPVPRLGIYLRALVAHGHKVGVVRQTESASAKSQGDTKNEIFSRSLAGIYTQATLIGEDAEEGVNLEDSATGSYVMAVVEKPSGTLGLVAIQPTVSTILVYHHFTTASPLRTELERCLSHLQPSEILLPPCLSPETQSLIAHWTSLQRTTRVEPVPAESCDYTDALSALLKIRRGDGEDITSLPPTVLGCLGILLRYLQAFHLQTELLASGKLQPLHSVTMVQISPATLARLEVFANSVDGSQKGTLMEVLDTTATSFGRRLLRNWLQYPLRDKGPILQRQKFVQEILSDQALHAGLRKFLSGVPDLESILCSTFHLKCSPSRLALLLESLDSLRTGFRAVNLNSAFLAEFFLELEFSLAPLDSHLKTISLQDARKGNLLESFQETSNFPEVQKLKLKLESLNRDMETLCTNLCEEYSATCVTVNTTKYLIAVNNQHLERVPNNWLKVSIIKNATRFHPPEVLQLQKSIQLCEDNLALECRLAWSAFLRDFNKDFHSYKEAIYLLAQLDCYLALANIGQRPGYTLPEVGAEDIAIVQGRHPIVEQLLGDSQYVPTDLSLQGDKKSMVITGPNMGGKSCLVRQVALTSLLAQVGSHVPALSARLPIFDGIYTRMGAADQLCQRRSTFLAEAADTAEILRSATSHSLVILDELGRGTSTHDGSAIACATLEYLLTEIRCWTFFITHYQSVTKLASPFPHLMANYHVTFHVDEKDKSAEDVTYLYALAPGPAANSFGVSVGRLAGLPDSVVALAARQSQLLRTHRMKVDNFADIWTAGSPPQLYNCLRNIPA